MSSTAPQTDDVSRPPVESVEDVATLLGAPANLSSLLSNSAKVYKTVTASAISILEKTAVDLNAFASADPEDKSTGMRQLIETVKADFNRFADREVDLCKNLKSYSILLNTLVPRLGVSVLAKTVNVRVEAFRKEMNADADERAARAAQILKHVDTLDARITEAAFRVAVLGQQADAMDEQLRHQNVGRILINALKALFCLVDDEDGALTQLSIILGIAKSFLQGDFDMLFKNKKEMQAFIDKVKALQATLEAVKQSMKSMSGGMKTSVSANAALIRVWDIIAENTASLRTSAEETVGAPDQLKIKVSWQKAQSAADEAINTITGGATLSNTWSTELRAATSSVAQSSVPFPTSRAELELFTLAGDVGVDHMLVEPKKYNALTHLAQVPQITEKYFTVFSNMAANSADSASDDSQKKIEEIMKQLGPPATESIKEQLNTLAGDCNQVKNTFSNILQVPFLQNLSILNPFKVGNSEEKDSINMREVVQRYKDKYDSLQDKTVVAVKGLIAYSTIQIALLPRVELDAEKAANLKVGDGKLSVDNYYKACSNAISSHLAKATEIRQEHTRFLNEWQKAQTNIVQRINECKATAADLKKRIQEKNDEYRHKTIFGILEIIGGLACFAIGFCLPFMAPIAWGVGVSLIGVGIQELVDRGLIDDAIAELTSQFNAATSAANQLEILKTPFQAVESKIQNLVGIWNGIEDSLMKINMNVSTLQGAEPGVIENIWSALLPVNTKNWQDCKNMCTQYVNAIA